MPSITSLLQLCIEKERTQLSRLTPTHLFVILLRSLGFLTRLVYSLQPVSWKLLTRSKKSSPRQKSSERVNACSHKTKSTSKITSKAPAKGKSPSTAKSPYFETKENPKAGPSREKRKRDAPESNTSPLKKLQRNQKRLSYNENKSSDEDSSSSETEKVKRKKSLNKKKNVSGKSPDEDYHGRLEDEECYSKYKITKRLIETIDNDEHFEATSKPLKSQKGVVSKSAVSMLSFSSSESDTPLYSGSTGQDQWIEVYLPAEARWICIELHSPSVDVPSNCEKLASSPVQYVVSFDNDHAIKDVTCRYDSKWLSQTRKQRVDREWWGDVVALYPPQNKTIDSAEDAELHLRLLEQPLPKSIGEFKGHALFALERHLLKYEAIYPRTAATVGFIRSEAVYSRDCVHTLHSRENWMMEARVVRSGEDPYKVVRGRPKKNTPLHERDKVKLELFGKWQTEIYKPPRAKNGIVPKNEYGNVELFKPCMLPPGTVHVPVQGIQKVARKLKIDVAPAMMGWDFHGGFCHPVIEGVVVCTEFKQKLLDAWEREEEDIKRRAKERREKKIYDRWRHVLKSLLVRERLKRKYDFEETGDD